MTFYVVYNNQSSNILDIDTIVPSINSEFSIKAFDGEVPDLYFYKWDKSTLTFVPKTGIDRQLTVHQFLNRFTASERIAIKTAAKTDAALSDFMDMLYQASFVDPDSVEVYGGLYYLSILGLITQARIPQLVA